MADDFDIDALIEGRRSRFFTTQYELDGAEYITGLCAFNRSDADRLVEMRGIGERVWNEGRAPVEGISVREILSRPQLTTGDYNAALHAACFLGWLAINSRAARPSDILGDRGLVHQLAHLACGDPGLIAGDAHEPLIEYLITLATVIERRIPGWPQPT